MYLHLDAPHVLDDEHEHALLCALGADVPRVEEARRVSLDSALWESNRRQGHHVHGRLDLSLKVTDGLGEAGGALQPVACEIDDAAVPRPRHVAHGIHSTR